MNFPTRREFIARTAAATAAVSTGIATLQAQVPGERLKRNDGVTVLNPRKRAVGRHL